MRQRLVTVMNAKSSEIDVFMSLPSREGEQFAKAGWYADLTAIRQECDRQGLRLRRLRSRACSPLLCITAS